MATQTDTQLEVIDLGRLRYAEADAIQRERHTQVVAGEKGEAVILFESEPAITVSRRATANGNVLASETQLQARGGGDVTYHGPGQLVAYPIVSLAKRHLNVSQYMRLLEQAMIDTAHTLGVNALRVEGCTGVWVHPRPPLSVYGPNSPETQPLSCNTGLSKLGALGVRVSRGVALHGVALNVTTDLDHYQTIVPCGLSNRSVASMASVLSASSGSAVPVPALPRVKEVLTGSLQRLLFD